MKRNNNIKRIMAVAKAEKSVLKIVISIEDKNDSGATTKHICIDEWNSVFDSDKLDESCVKTGETLSIRVQSKEVAEQIIGLGEITAQWQKHE